MDKMHVMLEMKEDLLPVFKITGRGLFYSWMPLRRLVILARWVKF